MVNEVVSGEANAPESLMDQLRARRKEIAETRDTFLVIPGYEETGLVVKHRLMERHEVEAIGKRVFRQTKDRGERNMRILVEQLIDSTSGFFKSGDNGSPPKELLDKNEEFPVVNWSQLASQIGWDGEGGETSALYFMFGNNEFSIGQYGILLNRWMSNTGLDVDLEYLGEGV